MTCPMIPLSILWWSTLARRWWGRPTRSHMMVLMIEVFDQCLTPPDWHVIRYKNGISKILTLVIAFLF